MTDAIKVDIWSDVQCPWCYIGKRKFETGAEAYSGDVEVEYHSFELSPDTPVDFDGSPEEYLSQRKGMPISDVRVMLERVTSIAQDVGLHYDYDSVHQTNTVKAHELLHYAKAHGRQLDMKERLLKAYFIDGVPFFVIDGKYGISGAQDASVFTDALTRVHSEKTQ